MRRRRIREEAISQERWLVSYSDFITLLFALFVVLFATTYRDNQSIRNLARAIHNGFQRMGALPNDGASKDLAEAGAEFDAGNTLHFRDKNAANTVQGAAMMLRVKQELEKTIRAELANHEVALQTTPEGITVSLKELGFFDSGSATLKHGAARKIERIAKVLMKPGLEIRIEGHSDNQPIHNAQFGSNWELSTARATTVLLLLVNDSGFDPKTLSASGYGQYRPIADDSTTEGRRMNRRVDLVVIWKADSSQGY
jgi:chemotaxis protein MotB